jgi:hypothetical protein
MNAIEKAKEAWDAFEHQVFICEYETKTRPKHLLKMNKTLINLKKAIEALAALESEKPVCTWTHTGKQSCSTQCGEGVFGWSENDNGEIDFCDKCGKEIKIEAEEEKACYVGAGLVTFEEPKKSLSKSEYRRTEIQRESEKPAEDLTPLRQAILAVVLFPPYKNEDIVQAVKSYAESYHAKKCAECRVVDKAVERARKEWFRDTSTITFVRVEKAIRNGEYVGPLPEAPTC